MEIISALWYVAWSIFTNNGLDVVELTMESIGALIAVNPTITIIAIAAATPPRIPNFY